MSEIYFVHSKCCNTHWELVVENDKYELRCEKCNKPTGDDIQIIGNLKLRKEEE